MEKQAGIYIHIPFCIKKCAYCDFISFPSRERDFENYKNALIEEIKAVRQNNRKKIKTVFIGGGTPTVLPVSYIEEIMAEVTAFDFIENPEITIEANPKTLSKPVLSGLKRSGINRLSIGLQAWQDGLLAVLGRAHRLQDFLQNYEDARREGFQNINIDLMFGLPDQSMDMWHETIEQVLALAPEHISSYSLIVEEGTAFYEKDQMGLLNLPDEDTERQMYYDLRNKLAQKGLVQYEISNFAKPDFYSRHNVLYWEREDYYGFGLSAHSLIDNRRYANTSDMERYITESGNPHRIQEDELFLENKDIMEEFVFLGLRMTEGISIYKFNQLFGINFLEMYKDVMYKNLNLGLIKLENDKVYLTETGMDLSNRVMADFLLD